jgi:uncharacterized membrane-anchored protein YhcB (DUF1043 family)
MLTFVIGLFVGTAVGILIAALCSATRDNDLLMENQKLRQLLQLLKECD